MLISDVKTTIKTLGGSIKSLPIRKNIRNCRKLTNDTFIKTNSPTAVISFYKKINSRFPQSQSPTLVYSYIQFTESSYDKGLKYLRALKSSEKQKE